MASAEAMLPNQSSDFQSASLGTAFVGGWRKLPDELRVKILSSVLIYDRFLRPCLYIRDCLHTGDLIALASCRETSALAKEVFFTNNTLMLRNEPCFLGLVLPRLQSNLRHIRRLQVQLCLIADDWRFLASVASSSPEFVNLRHLSVTFQEGVFNNSGQFLIWFAAFAETQPLKFRIKCLEATYSISFLYPPSLRVRLGSAIFGGLAIEEREGKEVVADWHGTNIDMSSPVSLYHALVQPMFVRRRTLTLV
ncbi:hypothetical protein BDV96DRAFT_600964 [Lophiotrema nucula]|uniref:Uncharacterized protein n=1 Tax=Lophiotrema nucula TaxID=690887 RepID=A0A6A5Z439_9PLEO|nr:hypothetical protein BDV96DRAFT_600964 [Lophiotrema nucula]